MFISRFGSSILGFIATVYFARTLGSEVLGIYFLVGAMVGWAKLGTSIGIPYTVTKRVSEQNDKQEHVIAGFLLIATALVIASSLLYLFRDLVNQYLGAPLYHFVILLLCGQVIFQFVGAVYKGEELVHVPAVALGNEVPESEVDSVTSILDIHKTLLDLAGVETDEFVRGRNLFDGDIDDDRAVYAESTGVGQYSPDAKGILSKIPPEWNEDHYMLRTDDAMFIHDKDGDHAFDPETGESLPDREAELRKRVDTLRDDRRDFTGESTDEEMPDEVEDRLEHLGYK